MRTCSNSLTSREAEVRKSRVQSQPSLHKTLSQKEVRTSNKTPANCETMCTEYRMSRKGTSTMLLRRWAFVWYACLYPFYGALAVSLRNFQVSLPMFLVTGLKYPPHIFTAVSSALRCELGTEKVFNITW